LARKTSRYGNVYLRLRPSRIRRSFPLSLISCGLVRGMTQGYLSTLKHATLIYVTVFTVAVLRYHVAVMAVADIGEIGLRKLSQAVIRRLEAGPGVGELLHD
jgi:hypothetical protein